MRRGIDEIPMEMCKLGGILHPLERRRLAREMKGRSNSIDSKERGGWRSKEE